MSREDAPDHGFDDLVVTGRDEEMRDREPAIEHLRGIQARPGEGIGPEVARDIAEDAGAVALAVDRAAAMREAFEPTDRLGEHLAGRLAVLLRDRHQRAGVPFVHGRTLRSRAVTGQVRDGCRSVLAAVTLRVMKPRVAWICAVVNGAAALALATVLAPGVSLAPTAAGAAYITDHLVLWRIGWALWIASALSLLAFFWWWGSRLRWPALARIAVALAAVGVVADLAAETTLIAWSPGHQFDVGGPLRLSGVVANGLYSVAGATLTLRTARLPPWLARWTWSVWLLGFGLAIAALAGSDDGSRILTAALFALFIPWLVVFGRRLA